MTDGAHLAGGGRSTTYVGVHRLVAMRTNSRSHSTARHVLWLGGLLIVLGGLFGMHGLDAHGGAVRGQSVHGAMAGSPDGSASGAMAETAHHIAPVLASVTKPTGHTGMNMVATGMCMAVLAVGLMVVLLIIRAGLLRPPVWLVARPACAPAARGRDPDPPCLIRLSIQRC